MKKIVLCLMLCLCLATPALATTVLPDSIPLTPGDISPAFGPATTIFTNQYNSFGLMFGTVAVAIFNDPPLAWGGVNAQGNVDLLSPVGGFFVLPNTTTKATTGFVDVEVGLAAPGTIKLDVFDIHGNLLGSALNGNPLGPHNRTTAGVIADGIASFLVTGTTDTWGMDQIKFCGELIPVVAPIPGSLLLLGSGLLGLVGLRRRS